MGSGRVSKYDDPDYRPPPVPPNATRLLAEALLGSELVVTKSAGLTIQFDEPTRDRDTVRKVLIALRDNYTPEK